VAAQASLPARRNQSGVELEVGEHEAAHEEEQVVRDAGYEEEQLDEWGLAQHALQNPPERISVGLRAKREPLDLLRVVREQSDPLSPPPGRAGRSVAVQWAASWVSRASRRRSFERGMAASPAARLCLGSHARRPGGLRRDL
jgi:predicted RNA-binding protein YlxR (DUF448 family)